MKNMDTVLVGRNLCHSFGQGATEVPVLHHVALELRRGELALLMGPSGGGKSTLLSVLAGLTRPRAGTVLALGQDLTGLSDRERQQFRLRHCGLVFQGYNLFPALTARQQLEIVLRWGEGVGKREAQRRADAMLERVGLSRKADLRPAELSGGEKQRVAIGRALVKGPELCFADEPTSALDWARGEQVVELLRAAAHEQGAAVLAVTHDPRLVPHADRVFHLVDGHVRKADRVAVPSAHKGFCEVAL